MEVGEKEWLVTSVRPVYQGHMTLNEYGVTLPTGETTTYVVDDSVEVAVATLLLDQGQVVLSRQYRFPLRRWIYDLPGGARDPGETAEEAAVRECREEVGLEPLDLVPLASFLPNPGRSAWTVQLFFCDTARPSRRQHADPSEVVRAVRMDVADVLELLDRGQALDAGLTIALHAAARRGLL